MIDLAANIPAIERLMKLMSKYCVDEIAVDFINIKRTVDLGKIQRARKPRRPHSGKREKAETEEEADQNFLDEHTAPQAPEAPWDAIPDEALDRFTINGTLGGGTLGG